MNITVPNSTVHAPANRFTVRFEDFSAAHTEVILLIGNLKPLQHAFVDNEGAWEAVVDAPSGKYKCTLQITVLTYKSVGRAYDTKVLVLETNGAKLIASTQGNVPNGDQSDIGDASFELVV